MSQASSSEEKVIGSGLDVMDTGLDGSDSCFGEDLIGLDGSVDADLMTGGAPGCHVPLDTSPVRSVANATPSTPPRRVKEPFIGPLTTTDSTRVEDMKFLNSGFDDGDARRLLAVEMLAKSRGRAQSTPPRHTDAKRAALIKKYKRLRGYSTPPRGTKPYSRREKEILVSVRKFNEMEAAKYASVCERVEEYSREWIDRVADVPFNAPAARTEKMTGVSSRTVHNFARQDKRCELTPKKKPGRKSIDPAEWMLIDIRTIVRGKLCSNC